MGVIKRKPQNRCGLGGEDTKEVWLKEGKT